MLAADAFEIFGQGPAGNDNMLRKIIICGRSSAAKALLDTAPKFLIPCSQQGQADLWVDFPPIFDNNSLSQLSRRRSLAFIEQAMLTDAGGTLVISSTSSPAVAETILEMAQRHDHPLLNISLDAMAKFKTAQVIHQWINARGIEILQAVDLTSDHTDSVYDAVKNIFSVVLQFGLTREDEARHQAPPAPQTIEEAVADLQDGVPLKDAITIANMQAEDLYSLQGTLGAYIIRHYGLQTGNHQLMDDCRDTARKDDLSADQAAHLIISALWDKLKRSHKLRIIK